MALTRSKAAPARDTPDPIPPMTDRLNRSLRYACTLLALVAVSSALPVCAADAVLDAASARHLLARTGFGPSSREVESFEGLTRTQAVDRILRQTRTEPSTPPPDWTRDPGPMRPAGGPAATPEERKAYRELQRRRGADLRAWWMQEMASSPSPLTERMTLFWHNHFTSSQLKVVNADLMYRQNATFRANALGSFATLLHAAAKEPAMVIYLDSVQNRKAAPNENFAREVMELFTLGEGRYSEQDVKEAARAFTGWSLDRDTGDFLFRPAIHDPGVKTVFGRTGRFDGDAVLDLLLARPETSEFVVAKLWREFVSPSPQPDEVRRIAARFRAANYDIKVALHGLLLSDAFWSPDNRGVLVKSPVELVVGTLRTLELSPPDMLPFARAVSGMGQVLFAPPNVKGWPGGEAWINTDTLLARKQFLARIGSLRALPMQPGSVTAMVDIAQRRADVALARAVGGSRATQQSPGAMPVARSELAIARVDGGELATTLARDATARDRLEAAIAKGTRPLRFDAQAWADSIEGRGIVERLANAESLLLPLAPVTADVEEARAQREPAALVRAALLDPVYQLH